MGAYVCAHSSLIEKDFGDRFRFVCDGCNELGYGSCYTCTNSCNFHLHKSCHNAPIIMSHPFFENRHFVLDKSNVLLSPQAAHSNKCAACGTGVQGWKYVLTTTTNYGGNTIYLHPCCMQLPHKTLLPVLESVDCVHCQSEVRVGNKNEGVVKGWGYVTRGIALHVKCMKDLHNMNWERKYTNNSSIIMSNNNNNHGNGNEEYDCGTQDRGPGCQGNQGCGRMRKRDYFFKGLKGLVQAISILNNLGIIDLDLIEEDLMEFVDNLQGN